MTRANTPRAGPWLPAIRSRRLEGHIQKLGRRMAVLEAFGQAVHRLEATLHDDDAGRPEGLHDNQMKNGLWIDGWNGKKTGEEPQIRGLGEAQAPDPARV